MGARYLKFEISVIKEMYPTEIEDDIMIKLPGRNWTAISKYARSKLRLNRSRKAIGLAVIAGLVEAKRKREGDIK